MKTCKYCRTEQPLNQFAIQTAPSHKPRHKCKTCMTADAQRLYQSRGGYAYVRDRRLRSNFGICQQDYDDLFKLYGGLCAICRRPEPSRKNLCVDHDHRTGKVRGLLCNSCNRGIGLLHDDADLFMAAAAYLIANAAPDA